MREHGLRVLSRHVVQHADGGDQLERRQVGGGQGQQVGHREAHAARGLLRAVRVQPLVGEGERARLTVPPKLGYGKKGAPPEIPGDATLIFEVTLNKIL